MSKRVEKEETAKVLDTYNYTVRKSEGSKSKSAK